MVKINTKKITIVFILTILLMFAFTGCSNNEEGVIVENDIETEDVVIEDDVEEAEDIGITYDTEEDYIIVNNIKDVEGYTMNYPLVENIKDKYRDERLNGKLGNKSCMVVEKENGEVVPEFTNYEVKYKGSEILSIIYTDPVAYDADYFEGYNYTMKSNTGLLFEDMLFDTTDMEKLEELVKIFNKRITTGDFQFEAENFWGFGIYFEQLDSGDVDVVIYYYVWPDNDKVHTLHIPVEEVREYFTEEYKILEFK